jgi:hypothetical protein
VSTAAKKLLRLIGTAVVVVIGVRILAWLLVPALPLLVAIFTTGLVIYVAVNGIKR